MLPICIDFLVSHYLRMQSQYKEWNDVYTNQINSEIVIMGSSRAVNHFCTPTIEKLTKKTTYNLGIIAAHIDFDYLRLIELLKYCSTKPQIITLEVCGITLDSVNYQYNHTQIFPFMLYNENCYNCTNHILGFNKRDYYIPLLRYSGYIESLLMKSKNGRDTIFYKGYHPIEKHFGKNEFKGKEKNIFRIICIDFFCWCC